MIIIYSPRRILKKSLYFYDSSAYFLTYCIFIHFAIVNNYNCNYGVTIYSSHNWKERRFWVRFLTFSWNDLEHSQEEFSHYFTIVIAARCCITNNRNIGQNLQNYNKSQTCIQVAGKSNTFCQQNLCRYHPATFFVFLENVGAWMKTMLLRCFFRNKRWIQFIRWWWWKGWFERSRLYIINHLKGGTNRMVSISDTTAYGQTCLKVWIVITPITLLAVIIVHIKACHLKRKW